MSAYWFGSAADDRYMGLLGFGFYIAILAVFLVIAHYWPQISRGLERAVRWFWAAGAAPVVGISTKSVDEIFEKYGTKRAKKDAR